MLDSMLDSDKTSLRACKGFRRKYRDFSKTSRTGELAQAISFVFAQENLSYPIVMDFHGFLASQGAPAYPIDFVSPDFALLANDGDFKPSLLESKGTCPSKITNAVKGDLKEALNQCQSANAFMQGCCSPKLGAKNTFGTLVKLAETQDLWESHFSFCDPDEQGESISDLFAVARRYYSAYFLIAGDPEFSKQLFNQQNASQTIALLETKNISGSDYFTIRTDATRFNLFTPLLARQKNNKKQETPREWYIRKDLLFAIVNRDRESLISIFKDIDASTQGSGQQSIEFFRDGTACKIPDQ